MSKRKKIQTKIDRNFASEFSEYLQFSLVFCRIFLYSIFFWLLGRYHFSLLWLILLSFIQTIERYYHVLHSERRTFIQNLTKNFRPTIEKHFHELPSWISYPDFDRCEWINKLLEQLWPTISTYVENLVKNTVEPELKKQIAGLAFERIDLGDFPPRLGGVKIYTDNIRSDEIILDTELFYGGDMHIKMKYHSFKAGIKSLYIHGELRLVFKSIVSKIPFIGALELFFLRTPTIDFNLTDIANIIEIPELHRLLHLALERILETLVVIPNRLIIAFMNDIDINQLRFPKPDGILRIDIIEAKNLPKHDYSILLPRHSIDAFVMINIGQYKFKTHTHKSTNPKCYETFEVPIEESNTQQLQVTTREKLILQITKISRFKISVYDADINSDDYIGTLNIPIESIKTHELLDQWYDLVGTDNSTIHIRMNWFYLSNQFDDFQQIKQLNQQHIDMMLSKISHTLSTSLLIVYIERAEQLPSTQHGKTLEPYPFCSIKIDNYEEKTSIIKHSTNPSWMKSFMFMLVNPEQSILHISINDSNNKNHLIGYVELSIRSLMNEKDWISNRSYPVKSSFINTMNTKLHMKLQLQVLTKIHSIQMITNELESFDENQLERKKSKIQIHLINKHTDQQIVHQKKSSQIKKTTTIVQNLFSSCLQKITNKTSN